MSGSKGELAKKVVWEIGERVLALFPGADIPVAVLRNYLQYTFEVSQKALEEAISSGDLKQLNDEEKQKLIPIGYRFYEAVRAGMAKNNMKILSYVIANMIKDKEIKVNIYGIIENSIKDLAYQELVVLGCYLKEIKSSGYDFDAYKNNIQEVQLLTTRVFELASDIDKKIGDKLFFWSCQSVLAAFVSSDGWLN